MIGNRDGYIGIKILLDVLCDVSGVGIDVPIVGDFEHHQNSWEPWEPRQKEPRQESIYVQEEDLLICHYLSLICLLFVSYLPLFVLITILLIFSYFPLIEGQCLSSSSLGVHSRKMLSTRIDVRNQH